MLAAPSVAAAVRQGRARHPVAPVQQPDIRYVVRPVVRDSLVELDVTMRFTRGSSGQTRLHLPAGRFGVPDMHRFVRDLEVDAGAATSVVTRDSINPDRTRAEHRAFNSVILAPSFH